MERTRRERSPSEKNNYAVIIGSISTKHPKRNSEERRMENLLNSCAGKGRTEKNSSTGG
jgi:hypothetical protein